MRYKFDDITNPDIYKKCKVMFVTGKYNLFNNIVVDRLKETCYNSVNVTLDEGLLAEFGMSNNTEVRVSNTVDFNTFTSVIQVPNINGKWFCAVDIGALTKKQTDWIKNYIKNPSENGILVLSSIEYKHYRFWLNQRVFNSDDYVHLIEVSFPRRETLKKLVYDLFNERNVRIEEMAIDLFITRMSSSYDDYMGIIDKICLKCLPDNYMQLPANEVPVITYQDAFDAMKGIENFVIDDLLEKMAKPLSSDNPNGKSVIFRMMGYMVEEYGARSLVNILISKIDELIEFRLAINSGCIPIIIPYSISESKKMLGEDSRIAQKSDFQFRRLADLASKTSLEDWMYMKLILMNTNKYSENSYLKALYAAITRSVNTESRINNDIGVENILKNDFKILSSISYVDGIDELMEG